MIDGITKIEPGATVRGVLTRVSRLAAEMKAPYTGTEYGCFGDHVFWEGLFPFSTEHREYPGVYFVWLGS